MTDLIKVINEGYERRAAEDSKKHVPEVGVIRASSCGYQARRLALSYSGIPEKPITGRSARVFQHGHDRHFRLRQVMAEMGVKGTIPVKDEDERTVEYDIGDGWKIVGHLDAELDQITHQGRVYENVILDIKTSGSKGWSDVQRNLVNDTYMAQAQAYMAATGKKWFFWLYERKDTQQLALACAPFSQNLWHAILANARLVAKSVDDSTDPLELPECSGESYGWQRNGRLGWKCSYCPYWQHCFPKAVSTRSARGTVEVRPGDMVKPGSKVIDWGHDVTPDSTWEVES